jgi:transposase InsO family protein
LEQVCPTIGCPKTIRVDKGSKPVFRDLDLLAYAKGVTLDFRRLGKPTDNAYTEVFTGRFRAECLNAHWFLTLADAAGKMEDWRRYYNEARQRGGDRAQGADLVAQSRWRHQPAVVKRPGNSIFGGPKNGIRATKAQTPIAS